MDGFPGTLPMRSSLNGEHASCVCTRHVPRGERAEGDGWAQGDPAAGIVASHDAVIVHPLVFPHVCCLCPPASAMPSSTGGTGTLSLAPNGIVLRSLLELAPGLGHGLHAGRPVTARVQRPRPIQADPRLHHEVSSRAGVT